MLGYNQIVGVEVSTSDLAGNPLNSEWSFTTEKIALDYLDTVTISVSADDLVGNALNASWSFTTEEENSGPVASVVRDFSRAYWGESAGVLILGRVRSNFKCYVVDPVIINSLGKNKTSILTPLERESLAVSAEGNDFISLTGAHLLRSEWGSYGWSSDTETLKSEIQAFVSNNMYGKTYSLMLVDRDINGGMYTYGLFYPGGAS